MTNKTSQNYMVVFHRPGAGWQAGLDFREQAGIGEHVAHYAQLNAKGKLEMGGPFSEADRGGMMVASSDVNKDELEEFAAADPAVKAGLLEYEVLSWYVPMMGEGSDGQG
jgi:uncharacterized protein YciI